MKCPQCGHVNAETEQQCECGFDFKAGEPPQPPKPFGLRFLSGFCVVLGLLALIFHGLPAAIIPFFLAWAVLQARRWAWYVNVIFNSINGATALFLAIRGNNSIEVATSFWLIGVGSIVIVAYLTRASVRKSYGFVPPGT